MIFGFTFLLLHLCALSSGRSLSVCVCVCVCERGRFTVFSVCRAGPSRQSARKEADWLTLPQTLSVELVWSNLPGKNMLTCISAWRAFFCSFPKSCDKTQSHRDQSEWLYMVLVKVSGNTVFAGTHQVDPRLNYQQGKEGSCPRAPKIQNLSEDFGYSIIL